MTPANLEPRLITVRDVRESDIKLILDYWHRSPRAYLESIAVDPDKLGSEQVFETWLHETIRANAALEKSKLKQLAIAYDGETIGVHPLTHFIENDSAIFHAHIFEPDFRRRGVGNRSYPQALRTYFERFDFKKIVFKTPSQNTGAIRVKEKLGIREVGVESINFDIVRAGTVARVFEVTQDELETIERRSLELTN